ncbi:TIGR02587 family membrane protein [Chelativorans salis]|uniref:TIGR02587 family membrane protein n=1 Tax=Chelativorans salis TaxID=2978478 RepID=A0ABT2LVP2_9HYPH|nr:TIGR02587 family membrane protein [Chelativorans sp. EGI FJ00035]MCT7378451.1 TIGR02587 family membrane protein [Chelativorans sp. EGI FJ00035]
MRQSPRRKLLVGLGRGFGGALIFGLPMLMTMEMWWLGFYVDRFRLALLLILNVPLLILLSHHAGFEETTRWHDDLRDVAVAYAIGIVASVVVLAVFGVVTFAMPADEIVGKVALQSVPASIGALLGRSQLGGSKVEPSEGTEQVNYASELFLMAVGALFLSLNVAPTEEMVLISYKMTGWHALALIALSIFLMHAFVYALEFAGSDPSLPPETPWWSAFLRFTVTGYAIALLISLYALWTFGRTDDVALMPVLMSMVVLAFPAAIGAAAARLIL